MARKYTDAVKLTAAELWAKGATMRDVARDLGVPHATVASWREHRRPVDWDALREDLLEEAREATRARLLKYQEDLHEQHWRDWDRIRQGVMMSIADPVYDGDGRVIQLRPKHLTPAQARDAANAYAQVQRGQRLAVGLPADFTVTATRDERGPSPREQLEQMGLTDADLAAIGDQAAALLSAAMDAPPEADTDAALEDLRGED